jgi:hypothetical protein
VTGDWGLEGGHGGLSVVGRRGISRLPLFAQDDHRWSDGRFSVAALSGHRPFFGSKYSIIQEVSQ